jgi:alpha-1,6-mannosyltransferase
MNATSPIPRIATGVAPAAAVGEERHALRARRRIGTAALTGLVVAALALAATAAGHRSVLVPGARTSFPGWMSGPLHALGFGTSAASRDVLLVTMSIFYVCVLICVDALPSRRVGIAIVLAHVALLLGPPLLSADVFGYVDYARLGVLHGLDPYTHAAAAAPHDAVYRFIGWQHARSPYGPLFTLFSYIFVPLGVAGAIWAFKVVAVLASLATTLLIWRCAPRRGRPRLAAAAFFGLNPVVLVFVVGGAHNDALLMLGVAAAVALALRARPAAGAATSALAIGLKASAGLLTPFLVLGSGDRLRSLAASAATIAALVVVALVGFGSHAADLLGTLRGQQQLVATHSVPAELSSWLGLGPLDPTLRSAFVAAFGVAAAYALWRAWRGADWLTAGGWATFALLVSTAWLLPWYGVWLLVPAALSADRRLRIAALGFSLYLVATRLPLAAPLLDARA